MQQKKSELSGNMHIFKPTHPLLPVMMTPVRPNRGLY